MRVALLNGYNAFGADRARGPSLRGDPAILRQALRQLGKTNAADAETICEASVGPDMRLAPVKMKEQ